MIVALVALSLLVVILFAIIADYDRKLRNVRERNIRLDVKAKAFDKIHYELDNEFDEYCKANTNLPWQLYELTRNTKRELGEK